jgi:hypothetical protein
MTADHGWTVSGKEAPRSVRKEIFFGRTDGGLLAVRSAECGPAEMRRYRV